MVFHIFLFKQGSCSKLVVPHVKTYKIENGRKQAHVLNLRRGELRLIIKNCNVSEALILNNNTQHPPDALEKNLIQTKNVLDDFSQP